jgi:predicted nucleotidyltransferase
MKVALAGVLLGGSLAEGAEREGSDVDFRLVISKDLTKEEKQKRKDGH